MSLAVPGKSNAISAQCRCLKSAEVRHGTPLTLKQLWLRLLLPPLGDGLSPLWRYSRFGAVFPVKMGLGSAGGESAGEAGC